MDARFEQVTKGLRDLGYTAQFVADHWNSNWRDKRWFGFEDPTERILQIVTANVYTRLVLAEVSGKEPFVFAQYVCHDSPGRPKAAFHRDQDFSAATRKGLAEILQLIPGLEAKVLEREAA